MQQAKNPAAACVLGHLTLVRPLAYAGVPCVAVAPANSRMAHSRLCWNSIDCDTQGISESGDEILELLTAFAKTQPQPPVLFYEDDEQLLFVSRNRERLAECFRFVIAAADLVENLSDKLRFHILAQRLGLPVPATRHVRPETGSSPPELDFSFPIVAKPLRRGRAWEECGYATKAVPITSEGELREWWPRWVRQGLDLLLQEMIPGPETRIESYHAYVDSNGGIIGEFTGRKLRTWPLEFGYSTALTLTQAPDVARLGQSLVLALGLRGVAKLDFKRAPNGGLYLLEVNPRFSLWHQLGAAAGVNLPLLVYRDLTGAARTAPGMPARAGAVWCRLSEDWRAARASGISLHEWLRWALACDAQMPEWSDPVPHMLVAWDGAMRRVRHRLGPKSRSSASGSAVA